MEPLAALSLLATIGQLIEYSGKLIERLNQYRSFSPHIFGASEDQLRLLRNNLDKTKVLAKDGQLDRQTEASVIAVVRECEQLAQNLEAMLKKVEPSKGDSKWRLGRKIFLSVKQEKKIKEINERIQNCVFHLLHHQSLSPQVTSPPPVLTLQRTVSASIMPPKKRDEYFTGRVDQLEKLEELLKKGGRAALYGLGGVGKSQIAIEYSHSFLKDDPGAIVLWIYASSIARIHDAYKSIAANAGLPGHDDNSISKFELVSKWLADEATGSWLMILDNADMEDTFFSPLDPTLPPDQQKTFHDYIPEAPNGKALITSRCKNIATRLTHRKRIVEVPNFSEAEGRQMLENAIGEEKLQQEDKVRQLLKALEHLPLAIAQAAAYIDQNDISISKYLELFEGSNQKVTMRLCEEFEDSRRVSASLKSVIASWEISFDYLMRQKPKAAALLSLMSMYDGKAIPERLLLSPNETEADTIEAIGVLKAFSLVSKDGDKETYTLHRLIHLATRFWVKSKGDDSTWHERAVRSLLAAYPAKLTSNWRKCNELEPHAEAVLVSDCSTDADQINMIKLLQITSGDRYSQGHSEPAAQRASRALLLSRKLPQNSERDLLVAKSLTASSWAGFANSKYKQAIESEEEALSLYEKHFGDTSAEAMQSRSRLSKFLMKDGQLKKAYEIQVALLRVQREMLGTAHDDTLFTMNRLVATLRKLKRYEEALDLSEELVTIRSKTFGDDHYGTCCAKFNRAELLYGRKRISEAQSVMQEAYDGFQRAFGEERLETKEALECLQIYKRELEAEDLKDPDVIKNTVTKVIHNVVVQDHLQQHSLGWQNSQDTKQAEIMVESILPSPDLTEITHYTMPIAEV